MKYCPYCQTDYAPTQNKCPSCQAPDYKNKCDNCGTVHESAFCTNCGLGIHETLRDCPKCGSKTKERVCPKCGHDIAATTSVKSAAAAVVSKASCKIIGHSWLGCKCTRCGETRDEEHDFHPTAGKCEQKCSACGKAEELPHEWNGGKCKRCGASMGPIDRLLLPISTRFPFLHLEKKENLVALGAGLLLVVVMLISGIFSGIGAILESGSKDEDKDGKLAIPSASASFAGDDYRNVIHKLEEAGFTNIAQKPLEDLVTGWVTKEGTVTEVEVDGHTDYSSGERYPKDVKIIVSYHSFPPTQENTTVTDAPTSAAYQYKGPEYEIVDSHSTGIGLTLYWVYTKKFDYSNDKFKEQVKMMIADIAHKENTNQFIVEVYTDKEAIYFNSDNTMDEYMNRYGNDYYQSKVRPKETSDWVALYYGGADINTGARGEEDSDFAIDWMQGANANIEKWKPE